MTTFNVIGKPVGRVEGPDKVTGAGKYAADVILPGMLFAKVLRSPHAHANIKSIDTTKARALPGVHAVLTAADVPPDLTGRNIRDMPLLARDRVLFAGEKVAVVAAEDAQIAERALELIEVDYEELPAVFDSMDALDPSAPVLHPDLDNYVKGGFPKLWSDDFPRPDDCPPNLYSQVTDAKGDIAAGFAQADHIIESTYTTPMTHQGYMETHACMVNIDDAGRIQIWSHNKQPHGLRTAVATVAGVEPNEINVNVAYIGGDFGGKSSPMDVPLMVFVARATGRPIKMVMSYTEEFMASNPRHPAHVMIKTGVMNDGTIVARHARATMNCGAYAAFKPQAFIQGAKAGGAYNIPNTIIEIVTVYTNTVPRGHSRSPGSPQATFAVESHTDLVAHAIGMDPLDFRRKNVLHDGDTTPSGKAWLEIKLPETLEAAAEAIDWDSPKAPFVGRGLSMFDHNTGQGNSTATVKIQPDGSATVLSPTFDQGAGIHTLQRQIVAEELSLAPEQVRIVVVDTDSSVPDSGVGNSRTTFLAGQAAKGAAEDLREKLLALGAGMFECAATDLALDQGRVVKHGGTDSITLGDLVTRAAAGGDVPSGFAEFKSGATDVTSFVTQACEVEVDPETGQVEIKKFITTVDSGTILNPIGHKGQIQGGFVTGLGYALMEEMPVDQGHVTTLSFADYKIPSMADLPKLTTVYLPEIPSGPAPYASKSVGETHNPPVAAAIANAVADAIGTPITSLPLTAEKIRATIARR
jgi:CO/xanthine dehydrogenase Mo-binding subunit